MRIKCLTTFKDGIDEFVQDDIRSVEDSRGAYFVANGWAEDLSGALPTGETVTGAADLSVASATLGTGDNHG